MPDVRLAELSRIWPRLDSWENIITDLVVAPVVMLGWLFGSVAAASILIDGWVGPLVGVAFWLITAGQVIRHEYRLRKEAVRSG